MSEEIKQETGAESATAPVVNDIAQRVTNFNIELKQLLGKYELALGAEAKIVDGRVLADPKVMDARVVEKK